GRLKASPCACAVQVSCNCDMVCRKLEAALIPVSFFMAKETEKGFQEFRAARVMMEFQDPAPTWRSTWFTRKEPSSASPGTASLSEPCIAFMKENFCPDISSVRIIISDEAYCPTPRRSKPVWAALTSPASHQAGILQAPTNSRPDSPKKR